MRFTWKGNWKKGEITIEADTLEELERSIKKVISLGKVEETQTETPTNQISIPTIGAGLGCSNSIRALLQSDWGREPRTMKEIEDALEANALYFSKGTLSGTLTMMTKTGSLRRIKRAGRWAYILR